MPTITKSNDQNKWEKEFSDANKYFEDYYKRCDKLIDIYKDKRRANSRKKRSYNIFWSNVQTLKSAVYAQTPKPVVQRRFKDEDRISNIAGQILERALAFEIEEKQFDKSMKRGRDDRLIVGRGQIRVRYEAVIDKINSDGNTTRGTDQETTANEPEVAVEGHEAEEVLKYECTRFDYVFYKDFIHSPARIWDEVRWVGFRSWLTAREFKDRFPKANYLEATTEEINKTTKESDKVHKNQAEVWEIWDKASGKIYWFNKNCSDVLDMQEPEVNFTDFFPCPEPAFATVTNDSTVPEPDYVFYQDHAADLDETMYRMGMIVEALKVRGVYDSSLKELVDLYNGSADNAMIPVKNFAQLTQGGGIKGAIDFAPTEHLVAVLLNLKSHAQYLLETIYQISGISDIIRGYSAPSETATAQQIKGQFASIRLDDIRNDLSRFARDTIAIAAEMIAETYSETTLAQIAGLIIIDDTMMMPEQKEALQFPKVYQSDFVQAVSLLRDDVMRKYRIDIETDSTIAIDEKAEQEAYAQFVQVTASLLKNSIEAAQAAPELVPLLGEVFKAVVRRYRVGRSVEDMIDKTIRDMGEKSKQPLQEPQPDHNMMRLQLEAQKIQLQQQTEQQKLAFEAEKEKAYLGLENQKMQQDKEIKLYDINTKAQTTIELKKIDTGISYIPELQSAQSSNVEALNRAQQENTAIIVNAVNNLTGVIHALQEGMNRPKKVIRDGEGNLVGIA